jgi:hypothetical protein
LMTSLGVEVNPVKGFLGSLIEFAKRWFASSRVNLTPIGGKVLANLERTPLFLPALIIDLLSKEYLSLYKPVLQDFINVLGLIKGLRKDKWSIHTLRLWRLIFILLGPQSGLWKIEKSVTNVASKYSLNFYFWMLFDQFIYELRERFSIHDVLKWYQINFVLAVYRSGSSFTMIYNDFRKFFIAVLWPKSQLDNWHGETLFEFNIRRVATLAIAAGQYILALLVLRVFIGEVWSYIIFLTIFPIRMVWYQLAPENSKRTLRNWGLSDKDLRSWIKQAVDLWKSKYLRFPLFGILRFIDSSFPTGPIKGEDLLNLWNKSDEGFFARWLKRAGNPYTIDINIRDYLLDTIEKLKSTKPIQILSSRFVNEKPTEDILPAARIADRFLREHSQQFRTHYFILKRKETERKRKLELKRINKKTGKVSPKLKT